MPLVLQAQDQQLQIGRDKLCIGRAHVRSVADAMFVSKQQLTLQLVQDSTDKVRATVSRHGRAAARCGAGGRACYQPAARCAALRAPT
jgi:hypothetical protein